MTTLYLGDWNADYARLVAKYGSWPPPKCKVCGHYACDGHAAVPPLAAKMAEPTQPSQDWVDDCMRWRGKVLTGKFAHWCHEWDGLPVDETTPEWHCSCYHGTKIPGYGVPEHCPSCGERGISVWDRTWFCFECRTYGDTEHWLASGMVEPTDVVNAFLQRELVTANLTPTPAGDAKPGWPPSDFVPIELLPISDDAKQSAREAIARMKTAANPVCPPTRAGSIPDIPAVSYAVARAIAAISR